MTLRFRRRSHPTARQGYETVDQISGADNWHSRAGSFAGQAGAPSSVEIHCVAVVQGGVQEKTDPTPKPTRTTVALRDSVLPFALVC